MPKELLESLNGIVNRYEIGLEIADDLEILLNDAYSHGLNDAKDGSQGEGEEGEEGERTAKSRRNCDVGTADEQAERFIDYCCGKCDGSKCKQSLYREDELYKCAIKWAQMPYSMEEGEAK